MFQSSRTCRGRMLPRSPTWVSHDSTTGWTEWNGRCYWPEVGYSLPSLCIPLYTLTVLVEYVLPLP